MKFGSELLKELMQLPTVSGSIEVWDFLSVDSQTYLFSNSFSIIQTLSDHAPSAIVGLVGRKEYEQCARDLYFFLQDQELTLIEVQKVLVEYISNQSSCWRELAHLIFT
ncbi:putative Phox domain, sorting nexin [Senna tora]|uniref:Putative Phox domain, sorting nexin n=1 Tax=Senna tora TaxID=362788 RepID=A0A834WU00_9FABA|nr:putative Phox domain, sorting nexin [Senna tora]